MTVRIYHSTDASAPVLSGQVGALIGVLDACLVNGYGSKAAAGWTKAYSGTNLAAYRQPAGTNQFYLRVDDTNATDARLRGYEAMSDVNTGTGLFPTDVQVSGGLYHNKSNASSSAARPWTLITNGKIVYFVTSYDGTNLSQLSAFGDITSYKSGDAYHTMIMAANSSGTAQGVGPAITSGLSNASNGHYMARSYTQTGSSVALGKHSDYVKTGNASAMGTAGMTYPTSPDGALWFAPVWIHESAAGVVRGEMPGFWCPLHNKPLTSGDTFTGSGAYSGKTFEAWAANNSSTVSQVFVETSDTW